MLKHANTNTPTVVYTTRISANIVATRKKAWLELLASNVKGQLAKRDMPVLVRPAIVGICKMLQLSLVRSWSNFFLVTQGLARLARHGAVICCLRITKVKYERLKLK